MAARPLQLDDPLLIGRGLHRECYQHPEYGNLCVKVVVAGNSDENRRESRYYRQLEARGISWDMLARFHGLVDTSRGEGAVFDLVRDFDGEVSRPDPVSRFQPEGVHGASQVIDDQSFAWTDQDWKGVAKRDLIIYRINLGADKDDFALSGNS